MTTLSHQAVYIGLQDVQGQPVREGDVLKRENSFRFVVTWNEFINDYSILPVPCYNSMRKGVSRRAQYLEDSNPLKKEVVDSWKLKIKCNIYENPEELHDNGLF